MRVKATNRADVDSRKVF